jgi:hypothetical protein
MRVGLVVCAGRLIAALAAEGALMAVAALAEVRLGFGQIQIREGEHHGGGV